MDLRAEDRRLSRPRALRRAAALGEPWRDRLRRRRGPAAVFYDLLRRRGEPRFFAFDLLWLDGEDLRQRPLVERKRILASIIPPQPAPVLYVSHVEARGVGLFRVVCGQDLEGIVAKLASAPYDPAAGKWVKIKNRAYSQAEGRADFFDERAPGGRAPIFAFISPRC